MKKDIFLALLVALALTFCSIQPAFAGTTIIYVDIGATGSNDGTSWENAYPLLQMALDQVNTRTRVGFRKSGLPRGLAIQMMGRGTCKTAGMNHFRILYNNVQLFGGFDGTELTREERDWSANATTLSGRHRHAGRPHG